MADAVRRHRGKSVSVICPVCEVKPYEYYLRWDDGKENYVQDVFRCWRRKWCRSTWFSFCCPACHELRTDEKSTLIYDERKNVLYCGECGLEVAIKDGQIEQGGTLHLNKDEHIQVRSIIGSRLGW